MIERLVLYDEVTKIAEDYFGPAAPRFIDRLIQFHLNKRPEQLTRKDLKELSAWAKLAVAMITDEEVLVQEFIERLEALAKG